MSRSGSCAVGLLALAALAGCQENNVAPAQAPQSQPYYPQPAPHYGPPAPYPQGPAPVPAQTPVLAPPPAQAPVPAAAPAQGTRPVLGPLVGPLAWQAEVRAVESELVSRLSAQNRARVVNVPLVFDPNPNQVNAFAGCDDGGAPFVAATEGLLEAVDAIAQTRATDELFSTQTYVAYVGAVAPGLVSQEGGSAALPAGILPPQALFDVRRISRSHEMFDEIVAFTFGHELAHHYLGHTGCANGQAAGFGPALEQLGRIVTNLGNVFNQPNEIAADSAGCINVLDTGLTRASVAYRWRETGGLVLLDFFAALERASGANPFLGFLRTHPNPGLRIPIVQGVAATWRLQHPGT